MALRSMIACGLTSVAGFCTVLVLQRPPAAQVQPAPGEAQLALACLRAVEMLADDSNHRGARTATVAKEQNCAFVLI